MVQAWYQGGISVFDLTDAAHPKEIAFFDRGPVDSTRMASGGSWSAYWYNGVIVSSEIARGLDIFELTPSRSASRRTRSTRRRRCTSTTSTRRVSRSSSGRRRFALARAYVDQLERSQRLVGERGSSPLGRRSSGAEKAGPARRGAGALAARVAARQRCGQLERRREGANAGRRAVRHLASRFEKRR